MVCGGDNAEKVLKHGAGGRSVVENAVERVDEGGERSTKGEVVEAVSEIDGGGGDAHGVVCVTLDGLERLAEGKVEVSCNFADVE